jgi:hypothetical protein
MNVAEALIASQWRVALQLNVVRTGLDICGAARGPNLRSPV